MPRSQPVIPKLTTKDREMLRDHHIAWDEAEAVAPTEDVQALQMERRFLKERICELVDEASGWMESAKKHQAASEANQRDLDKARGEMQAMRERGDDWFRAVVFWGWLVVIVLTFAVPALAPFPGTLAGLFGWW